MIDPKRETKSRGAVGAIVRALLLLALLAALASCSEHAFLDDFPPYPPAEPYLEEQEVLKLRVSSIKEDQERLKDKHRAETRETSTRRWLELEEKLRRGIARKNAEEERQASARGKNSGPRNLDQWERIMH